MNDEANELLAKYTAQMHAVMEAFRVEATALAWKIASEVMNTMIPKTVAVGTLAYDGNETKVTIPAGDKALDYSKYHQQPAPSKPLVSAVIKGSGKITILGPKPKNRADAYVGLLAKKDGVWARRGSRRVQYSCVGWRAVPNGARPVFYLMKNTKTGKTITVKFESIVSDWTHSVHAND